MRTLGVIPARGGSKGVRRKNIRSLAGRPLIAYTIDSATESRLLTQFVVSTEDSEIAEISTSLGASVLLRPLELAADDTPMLPVVQHALGETPGEWDAVVILQPTTPLRLGSDIDEALRILARTGADSVISVYRVLDHHPARMYRNEGGRLVPYGDEPSTRLRQDLPPIYHRNGAVYACRASLVLDQGTYLGSDIRPCVMPRERSVNVDDELDLALAELMIMKHRQRQKREG